MKETKAKLQAVADLYADRELAKTTDVADRRRYLEVVAARFVRDHGKAVIDFINDRPDVETESIWQEYNKAMSGLREHQVPEGHHPTRDCDRCDGAGWVAQSDPRYAKRCTCFTYQPPVTEQRPRYEWVKSGDHYRKQLTN